MTNFLFTIFIYPVYMFVEFMFFIADMISRGNAGLSIIILSLAVNIICLPIYLVAEKWQEKERAVQEKLKAKIKDIKAVFSGDERYMMLSTYYRQNNYHPLYALRSIFPLLIQIPFFIAAYLFLSQLPLLQNASFLFLRNLSEPDGLLKIGSISVNLLPIVMTVINVAASAVYAHGFEFKDKLQLYISAAVFLVLLYNSPSGLVFYWTLNNLFSLLKNIFYKVRISNRIWYGTALGALTVALIAVLKLELPKKVPLAVLFFTLVVAVIPLVKKLRIALEAKGGFSVLEDEKTRFTIFCLSISVMLSLLAFVIPSTIMASSPTEFCNLEGIKTPFGILYYTITQCLGCALWLIALYKLFNKVLVQKYFAWFACIILTVALINVYIFAGNYGTISNTLIFEDAGKLNASYRLFLINIAVIFIGGCVMTALLFSKLARRIMIPLLNILLCVCFVVTIFSTTRIYKEIRRSNISAAGSTDKGKAYKVTKNGKNIFIFMLDRSMNFFLDPIFDHCSEVQTEYTGFTVFKNTIAFGSCTNVSTPSLFGGYEYTPENINKRSNELLVDKHNEALSVLPKLFSEHGWNVSFTDPPWLNYVWNQDLSVFDKYNMTAQNIDYGEKYIASFLHNLSPQNEVQNNSGISGIKRNMLMFSFFRILPHEARRLFYAHGKYALVDPYPLLKYSFLSAYSALENLEKEVEFIDSGNCINIIGNTTTHEPPDAGNIAFIKRSDLFPIAESCCCNQQTEELFYANYLAHEACAKFFRFLKENHCYDNSRIIIVGDHGDRGVRTVNMNFIEAFETRQFDPVGLIPLLMMKDFNTEGILQKDYSFMTLADVPILATEGLSSELQKNPFSGIPFKQAQDKRLVKVAYSADHQAADQLNFTRFKESDTKWIFVKDNVYDPDCWSKTGFEEE